MNFITPPIVRNTKKKIRRVGYELEFSSIDLEDAAKVILDLFGGEYVHVSKYEQKINDSIYGDFKIELDSSLLTDKMYMAYLQKIGIDVSDNSIQSSIEDFLGKITALVIPYEIAAPPMPMDNMEAIEQLRTELKNLGATGTKDSIVNAFGLHINIEVPSLETKVLLNYLRAFFLTYSFIFEKSDIDFVRRIPPFINEFPENYINLVLDVNYNPSMKRLIEDYIEYNPTRNRVLDMLPILGSIDRKPIKKLKEVHVIPRPAFHYRLPNSLVDDPSWNIASEWNNWVIVEYLANFPDHIQQLSGEYLQLKEDTSFGFDKKWNTKIKKWLRENDFQNR